MACVSCGTRGLGSGSAAWSRGPCYMLELRGTHIQGGDHTTRMSLALTSEIRGSPRSRTHTSQISLTGAPQSRQCARGPALPAGGRPHCAPPRTAGAPRRRGAAHRRLSAVRGPRTGHRGRGAHTARAGARARGPGRRSRPDPECVERRSAARGARGRKEMPPGPLNSAVCVHEQAYVSHDVHIVAKP